MNEHVYKLNLDFFENEISHCALFISLQALWSVHSKKNLPINGKG